MSHDADARVLALRGIDPSCNSRIAGKNNSICTAVSMCQPKPGLMKTLEAFSLSASLDGRAARLAAHLRAVFAPH
jgi:hypothetical protein